MNIQKKIFSKKPTSVFEQLNLLISRGLIIDKEDRVIRYLNQISYYRLSAYFMPYQSGKNQFNSDTNFDLILDTYKFDRKLRLLVFDSIERIEVAIRAQMINVLCKNHNTSHWQDDKKIFKEPYENKKGFRIDFFDDFQKIIDKNCMTKNPEVFIQHYNGKYRYPKHPPSWMCVELLTIGELSRLYKGLKLNSDKQDIADYFHLHHIVFESWLHTLTYVRNICAHHSRLWNRDFAIKPQILRKPIQKWVSTEFNINNRVFFLLCILKYLLFAANPNNNLKPKLIQLFAKFPQVPIKYIGIPSDEQMKLLDWKNEPLWEL
jgi:abortive infection bacteriophage resistance protein